MRKRTATQNHIFNLTGSERRAVHLMVWPLLLGLAAIVLNITAHGLSKILIDHIHFIQVIVDFTEFVIGMAGFLSGVVAVHLGILSFAIGAISFIILLIRRIYAKN